MSDSKIAISAPALKEYNDNEKLEALVTIHEFSSIDDESIIRNDYNETDLLDFGAYL